eukprot:scaffold10862_cov98-Isochrysis_galbana.AAC.2
MKPRRDYWRPPTATATWTRTRGVCAPRWCGRRRRRAGCGRLWTGTRPSASTRIRHGGRCGEGSTCRGREGGGCARPLDQRSSAHRCYSAGEPGAYTELGRMTAGGGSCSMLSALHSPSFLIKLKIALKTNLKEPLLTFRLNWRCGAAVAARPHHCSRRRQQHTRRSPADAWPPPAPPQACRMNNSPVPFIQVDPTSRQLVVSDQGRMVLSSIKGTVGVCAVAGVYRTGAPASTRSARRRPPHTPPTEPA